jgi:DNA-binding NarL/FixJ family response regulator
LSNKEIAQRLSIQVQTVKNHVHNVLLKLGVSRRAESSGPRTKALAELHQAWPEQGVAREPVPRGT